MNGTSLITAVVCLILGIVLHGCASGGNLPTQIPQSIKSAADLYTSARPKIVAAREQIIAHWNDKVPGTDQDLIPAEAKKALREFDAYLPELDRAGKALVIASESIDAFTTASKGGKIDYDALVSTAIKGIGLGLEMYGHSKGAF